MSDPPVRASDAEREQAAESLREHFAAGRLTPDEFSQRLDAVYRATTVQELARVREDLPDLPLSPAARRAELQRRQSELRGHLLQHAGGAFAPFAICTLVWAVTGAEGSFWPAWLLIFPIVFLGRNIWRLYGPSPEPDRVERELAGHGRGHDRRNGHRRRELP